MTEYMRGLEQAAARAGMAIAIAIIEQLIARDPEATAVDALPFLSDRLNLMPGPRGLGPGEVQCRHCGYPIARRVTDGHWAHRHGGRWDGPGCRTAAFARDGAWDESLEEDLIAEPPAGGP